MNKTILLITCLLGLIATSCIDYDDGIFALENQINNDPYVILYVHDTSECEELQLNDPVDFVYAEYDGIRYDLKNMKDGDSFGLFYSQKDPKTVFILFCTEKKPNSEHKALSANKPLTLYWKDGSTDVLEYKNVKVDDEYGGFSYNDLKFFLNGIELKDYNIHLYKDLSL